MVAKKMRLLVSVVAVGNWTSFAAKSVTQPVVRPLIGLELKVSIVLRPLPSPRSPFENSHYSLTATAHHKRGRQVPNYTNSQTSVPPHAQKRQKYNSDPIYLSRMTPCSIWRERTDHWIIYWDECLRREAQAERTNR